MDLDCLENILNRYGIEMMIKHEPIFDTDKICEHYSKKDGELLHDFETQQVQRLIDYLDVVKTPHSDAFDMPKLHNDFKKFYQQYDVRRNKNFSSTFASLSNWYETL